jgi:hypothetical protein
VSKTSRSISESLDALPGSGLLRLARSDRAQPRSMTPHPLLFTSIHPEDDSSGLQFQEVLEDLPAMFGEDAFGMKLDAPDRELLVFDTHDFAFSGFGGDGKAIGKRLPLDDQGMVAGGGEWIGHAEEQVLAVMLDHRGFAMHHPVIHDDIASEGVTNALVSEANAQQGNGGSEGFNDFVRQAGFTGRAWAGRDEQAVGFEVPDLVDGNAVIAMDLHFRLQFAEVLNQVIGE